MERKLMLYIAASLDGFIAGENDNLNFLKAVEKEGEDYGYSEFIISVIPVLLGSGTRLFFDNRQEQKLQFVSSKTFNTGLVQLHYKKM